MFLIPAIAVVLTMALALTRALVGPSSYDRILALNMFGTKTVLLIGVSGFLSGRPEWMDLAIVYALLNFTGTLAVLRFARYGGLSSDEQAKAPSFPDDSSDNSPSVSPAISPNLETEA